MKKRIQNALKNVLKHFDTAIKTHSRIERLHQSGSVLRDFELMQKLNHDNAGKILRHLGSSKSQLRQDIFVLSHLAFKTNGYFVEFGATNGVDLSNTHLLEKEFGWHGILAEPAKCWHNDLKNNRSCNVETDCVWMDSNSTLTFNQVDAPEFSTIASYSDSDLHKQTRENGKTYEVNTISLNDLLEKYKAPKHIDYLSIDTEGSEYDILSHFDFSKYTFEVVTCEHNDTPNRDRIYSLLATHGYTRVLEDFSLFDDWYVRSTLPKS